MERKWLSHQDVVDYAAKDQLRALKIAPLIRSINQKMNRNGNVLSVNGLIESAQIEDAIPKNMLILSLDVTLYLKRFALAFPLKN
jgi:hypothetical protein